jgi:hypothetical protein
MASKLMTLPEMQLKLEEMFRYTSDVALGKTGGKLVPDVLIAAAQASAQLANVLMGIRDLILAEALLGPGGFDPDDFDHSPGANGDSEPE